MRPPQVLTTSFLIAISLTLIAVDLAAQPLVRGTNVNMASCTPGPPGPGQPACPGGVCTCPWPKGDPFLEAQNELTLAVSTRNSLHVVGGANDWRSRDIPGLLNNTDEIGDVGCGLFRSINGGETWESSLFPGFPGDTSPEGLASPLKGFQACADPVIRAGTNGLFYATAIGYNRGNNATGNVTLFTMIDNNNRENGSLISHVRGIELDKGTAGVFLDKPGMATDIPRAGAATANFPPSIPAQSIKCGNVYIGFSVFTGQDPGKPENNPKSIIKVFTSKNCGATVTSTNVSQTFNLNQGSSVAVDPSNGNVFVAWRRKASGNEKDAFLIAKSTDFGKSFPKPVVVKDFLPGELFDQLKSSGSFRTAAFPEITVDKYGRVYMVWSQRVGPTWGTPGALPDARVVITSAPGSNINAWSAPVLVAPLPATSCNANARGHQFFPAIWSAYNRVVVGYQHNGDDHTVRTYASSTDPDNFARKCVGNLDNVGTPADPAKVFTNFITDSTPGLERRHTLRTAVNTSLVAANGSLSFETTDVTQYKYGKRIGGADVEDLQDNPPNLKIFARGTTPMIGDYIGLTSLLFKPKADGTWETTLADDGAPVFHIAWADNRDVRPPLGTQTGPAPTADWTVFTPVANPNGEPNSGGASLFCSNTTDCPPGTTRPACAPLQSGLRNQNPYTSRLTLGFTVGSPGNDKPLGTIPGTGTLYQRAFAVWVQNTTRTQQTFRLTITNQPTGGVASFSQFPLVGFPFPLATLDVNVAARSKVSRSVYITSTDPNARVGVTVQQLVGGAPSGPTGSVTFNADVANPPLVNADVSNADVSNADVATAEVYNPDLGNADVSSADVANADVANADVASADVSSADVANADVSNADVANADVANADVSSADVASADVASAPHDANWTLTNTGNTSASFNTKLFLKGAVNRCSPNNCGTAGQPACPVGCVKFQLIVHRRVKKPAASGWGGCTPQTSALNLVLANITNPTFTSASGLTSADVANADVANATVSLAPGEEAQVTLRCFTPGPDHSCYTAGGGASLRIDKPESFVTVQASTVSGPIFQETTADSQLTTVGGSQSVNTADALGGATTPAATVTITTLGLPDGITNTPYATTLQTIGGTGLIKFCLAPGPCTGLGGPFAVGNGLSLSTTAVIAGTPLSASLGTDFTAQANDTPNATQPRLGTSTQTLRVRVGDPLVITTTSLPLGTPPTPYSAGLSASGGIAPLTWSLVSQTPAGSGFSVSSAGITSGPSAGGVFSLRVRVEDSSSLNTFPNGTKQSAERDLTVILDNTPPVVTPTLTCATPGDNGWCRGSVTITWSVTDPESGIASSTGCSNGSSEIISVDTIGTTRTCSAINGAGLSSGDVTTAVIKIDQTAPVISGSRTPDPNAQGWNNTDVSALFTCIDATSGVAAGPLTPQVVSIEGAGQSRNASCTDNAGNTSNGSVTGINIDKTAPPLPVITAPANGGNYILNEAAASNYSCSDPLSGILTCAGTVPNGSNFSTSTVGQNKVFTVTATDNAGNVSTPTTNNYNVIYTFVGTSFPLNGFWGSKNLGAAVTLRWTLQDANSALILNVATVTSIKSKGPTPASGGVCAVSAAGAFEAVLYSPATGATGGSDLRTDSSGYLFNWDSSTANATGTGCYSVEVLHNDGVSRKTAVLLQ